MEAQVSNIFLSMWNSQKKTRLGSGLPKIPEQATYKEKDFAKFFFVLKDLAHFSLCLLWIFAYVILHGQYNLKYSKVWVNQQ